MRNKGKDTNKAFDLAVVCTIMITLVFTSITVSSSLLDDGSSNIDRLYQDVDIYDKEFQRIISTLNDDMCDDCDDDDDPTVNKKPEAFIYQVQPNPGTEHETISFEGYGEDTDGTIIGYLWESDIDGSLSSEAIFSTSSLSAGSHIVTFFVQDDKYSWSDPVTVNLEITENTAPNAPFIAGNAQGKAGEEITFTLITSDPEGHDVKYLVDWGDGSIDDYDAVYASDESVEISHQWDEKGSYQVKAKAKDVFDAESDWGILDVQLSKTKMFNPFFDIVQWIINNYPILAPLFT